MAADPLLLLAMQSPIVPTRAEARVLVSTSDCPVRAVLGTQPTEMAD